MKPVFLFPGQGSQYVGMGKEFHARFSIVRELFEEASSELAMDLESLCFEGPESTLVQTDNVQPAVTLVNLACLHVLKDQGIEPAATAGHSLGEYAALYAAGAFSLRDALNLVRTRGSLMRDAAQANPGGMIAVMGLALERVVDVCERARSAGVLSVANHNSPNQIILTGQQEALELAASLAKKEGPVLVRPLNVSGPWHSSLMGHASEMMQQELEDCAIDSPGIPVASNVTGDLFQSVAEIRRGLVDQIVEPVRWVNCIERLLQLGHRTFVEVGPGHMLAGLMRDIAKDVKVFTTESLDDLNKLCAFAADESDPET